MAAVKRLYWTEEYWDDLEKTLSHYHDDEEEALRAVHPSESRKRTRTDVYSAPVENDLVETKRRSILAATAESIWWVLSPKQVWALRSFARCMGCRGQPWQCRSAVLCTEKSRLSGMIPT
eukprot:2445493-Rhodomonas_salina.1